MSQPKLTQSIIDFNAYIATLEKQFHTLESKIQDLKLKIESENAEFNSKLQILATDTSVPDHQPNGLEFDSILNVENVEISDEMINQLTLNKYKI